MWEKTVCLVTGVGHGVGLGLATTLGSLLKNNSLLIITSRSKKNLAELTATIKAKNPNVTVCGVDWWDLTNPDAEQYRKDLKSFLHTAGLTVESFQKAVIIHNAARLGSMTTKVAEMNDVKEMQVQLNVNVVSMLSLNSIFLEIFKPVACKVVVNLTAPSANVPRVSFGMTAMCKAARQIDLSILALEEKSVRVLHYNPGAVDTESLQAVRDESHDPKIREWVAGFYSAGQVETGDNVAKDLIKVLEANKFESGAIVSAFSSPLG